MYSRPEQYSIPRNLLEVYKTDEEHFEPYISIGSVVSDESEDDESSEDSEGFTFHQGEIKETYYYGILFSASDEHDYEDMSNNGSVSLHEVNENQCYKGVRLLLRKDWEKPNETLNLEEMNEVLLGFITEQTYTENHVELKISGMSKLLEEKCEFSFTQMKRSEILSEMIKTVGLTPIIDTTGLDDDVIDYTNVSSDTGSGSSESADIKSLVKSIIKGKSSKLAKAKAIHEWLVANLTYASYSCSRYSTASECLKSKKLNCANTAMLTRAMMAAAGLNATVVKGPNHFWTVVTINGVEYASDASSNSRAWNTVWKNMTYTTRCGDNPSC